MSIRVNEDQYPMDVSLVDFEAHGNALFENI